MASEAHTVQALSAAWVAAWEVDWPDPVAPAEVHAAVWQAEACWGLAGVGLSSADGGWTVALLASAQQLPLGHPLAAAGLVTGTAGLLALMSPAGPPPAAAVKWLYQALAARLRDRCDGLEAQSGRRNPSPYCPAVGPLQATGFHLVPTVPQRYRLELASTALSDPAPLRWARRLSPHLAWAPYPAPAARQAVDTAS